MHSKLKLPEIFVIYSSYFGVPNYLMSFLLMRDQVQKDHLTETLRTISYGAWENLLLSFQ